MFLHEDLTVSRSCFDQDDIVFDAASPEWEAFCRDVLKFDVPVWSEEAAAAREELAESRRQSPVEARRGER